MIVLCFIFEIVMHERYWTEDEISPTTEFCFTTGPPQYYWKLQTNPKLSEIPDIEASLI